MTDRERLFVELVDDTGAAAGACTVAEAHTAPGRRHRAFSVLLYHPDGRVLLQQRAAVKTRFPLLWSNTCCGHPEPGQAVAEAACVRLTEELGMDRDDTPTLVEVGVHRYRAVDEATGRVEHEWDHVLVGVLTGSLPTPDPVEVASIWWTDSALLQSDLARDPDSYTPWLPGVLQVAAAARYPRVSGESLPQ
ncbi:isopentenyl-diphosphate Delta-isomerase [Labedaea rhizosphaerae]|uniref:Isopentenyl-diphosphate Delta-isomerase n=1 Tax=Labedaea rhizosphaerae TaxID=598644 RepID=A0A4R6RV81_LABRH|nr:isopentenyl-diphosphate Delta-isomerase [Labedaea rhizosphaerae]TDP90006.1 isopentenyl-diphosphate delta-isomerase [Labedaea rhizosphaerae]